MTRKAWEKIWRTATLVGALVVIVVILWIDIATGLWQDLVILAGLAAGLVTFLLTALVLGRITARQTALRWAPLNRLALSEFMHAMADEELSEISRGHVVLRTLPPITSSLDAAGLADELHELRHRVVGERRHLAQALSRWAEFLTTSGDNEEILNHAAGITLRLDAVRDAAVALEHEPLHENLADLAAEIENCNRHVDQMAEELHARIEAERLLLGRRLYG